MNKHDTKNNTFKLHSHSCYEIVYFLTGSGKTMIGDKSQPVREHSYCVVAPGSEHIECIEGYGEILFIGFEYDDSSYRLEEGVYYNGEMTKLSLFNDIFNEYREQELGFEIASKALLELFLISVLRDTAPENKRCKDLYYIKAYIEQHADQKINFRELASISGYSDDYFRYMFKQKFGIAPQGYMIDIRLNNAKQMLNSTSLSCTEVAQRCGFSNSAQLSAMFKKKWGISPSDVKKTDLYK